MASSDIKGFYKQKKKTTKPPSKKTSIKKRGGATLGSGAPPQTPALIAHGSHDLDNEFGDEEVKLRQFDMEMRYGPCVGMTRIERWERANSMGLDPPAEIGQILLRCSAAGTVGNKNECLWEGRV